MICFICVINQNNITGSILFTENLKEKKQISILI